MDRTEIADCIEHAAKKEFGAKRVTDFFKQLPTKTVMDLFGRLGKANGYMVAADTYVAGCAHADQGAWLYDMVWWTDGDDGMLSQLDMVLESELKPGGNVINAHNVDGDFQKLIQARASVRVWLTLIPNSEMVARHIENCKRQATVFGGKLSGDLYIFIVGDWTKNGFEIERYSVS
jgi:hypothetical protein